MNPACIYLTTLHFVTCNSVKRNPVLIISFDGMILGKFEEFLRDIQNAEFN
jgi:hypothetical protein